MKKFSYVLLLVISTLMFSCSKDSENEPAANYQVLGITSVSINGQQISVTDGVLLSLPNTSSIVIDGIEDWKTQKQIQLSYIVVTAPEATLSIHVESSFENASVVINEEKENGKSVYKVVVRREGYKEQITYVFSCLPVKVD